MFLGLNLGFAGAAESPLLLDPTAAPRPLALSDCDMGTRFGVGAGVSVGCVTGDEFGDGCSFDSRTGPELKGFGAAVYPSMAESSVFMTGSFVAPGADRSAPAAVPPRAPPRPRPRPAVPRAALGGIVLRRIELLE